MTVNFVMGLSPPPAPISLPSGGALEESLKVPSSSVLHSQLAEGLEELLQCSVVHSGGVEALKVPGGMSKGVFSQNLNA